MPGERAREQIRAMFDAVSRGDLETAASYFADDYELRDHRTMAWDGDQTGDPLTIIRGFMEMADDYRWDFEWIDGDDDAFVIRHIATGTARDTGGPFRFELLQVTQASADGFHTTEQYDLDALDTALARLAELRG